jgi:hypothetical protein
MQKWEYTIVWMNFDNKTEAQLNQLGDQGWELVAVDEGHCYFFKRPKS